MANGILTGDPRGFNKRRSSKFREDSRVRQTPEEGRRTYRPKGYGNNNKNEDYSPKNLNDKNQDKKFEIMIRIRNEHFCKRMSISNPRDLILVYLFTSFVHIYNYQVRWCHVIVVTDMINQISTRLLISCLPDTDQAEILPFCPNLHNNVIIGLGFFLLLFYFVLFCFVFAFFVSF